MLKEKKEYHKKTALLISLMIISCCILCNNVYAISDGVCNIKNPVYHDSEDGYSEYNYVYFGKSGSDSTTYRVPDDPILFRVLNTKANTTNDTDALLLLSEYDMFKQHYKWSNKEISPFGQTWSTDCAIKTLLNNNQTAGGILHDCFTTTEIEQILETYKDESGEIQWGDDNEYRKALPCSLAGDRLFLLSAQEAVNNSYGFSNVSDSEVADGNRIVKCENISDQGVWWLRSGHSDYINTVTCITDNGVLNTYNSNLKHYGIRFALNIPMSSILYASPASSTSLSSVLSPMPENAPSTRAISATDVVPETEYASKLTIKDSSRSTFQVTESRKVVNPGETITLNYTGAKTNAMEGYDNEYISVIIKDSDGKGLYYGTLQSNVSAGNASGRVKLKLPDLENGEYKLIVMNEQRNPAKNTNYAGYDTVALSVTEGVCNIENPIYYNWESGYSEYDYVYFGKTGSDGTLYDRTDEPILFRVLNKKANDTNNTDALLLLSEFDIFKEARKWTNKDESPYGQSWTNDCGIREILNNDQAQGGTLFDCFTPKERAQILETYNGEITELINQDLNPSDKIHWYSNDHWAYGCGLTGERLFLLSAKEALNKNYGFADENDNANMNSYGSNDGNRIAKRGLATGDNVSWWLRSAHSYNDIGVSLINTDGYADGTYSDSYGIGIRFALNIPLSSIVYASPASSTNSTSLLSQMPEKAPSTKAISVTGSLPEVEFASKLTIKDSTRNTFSVTESSIIANPGETVTLNYTGAKTNCRSTNEYISAIIKDLDGNGLYYGTLKANEKANDSCGEVEIDLPYLEDGKYTLMILNEQRNPEKETNYAGFDTVDLRIAGSGVCNIENPTYYNWESGYSEYDYVYFGKTGSDGTLYDQPSDPILFRVLNTKANNTSNTNALLLLSEFDIFKEPMQWTNKVNSPYGQGWLNDCGIRTMLNNDQSLGGTLFDCFTPKERAQILETYNGEITEIANQNANPSDKINWYDNGNWAYGCGLTGERLFLLSAKEVLNKNYGFADESDNANIISGSNDGNRIAKRGLATGGNVSWWLRSAHSYSDDGIAYLNTDGYADGSYSTSTGIGVRFALNIPLASIIYTSPASNTNSASLLSQMLEKAPSAKAISVTGALPGVEFASKLTIKDSARDDFQVEESSIIAKPEETITLNYTGAKTNAMEGYDNEYISVIIKDLDGKGLYYGTLQANTTDDKSEGEIEIELPELGDGEYTLMILNEQRNSAKETNYAGFDTVSLKIISSASNITNPTYHDSGDGYSEYNYIYFGKTGSDGTLYDQTNEPILFRVLNTKANDTNNTDALLLLSEFDIFKETMQWTNKANLPYGQSWLNDCGIRTMLNNDQTQGGTLYDCFTQKERNQILETYNGEITEIVNQKADPSDKINWYSNEFWGYGCGLTGERLFLLSAKEALNKNYGFANEDDNANFNMDNSGLGDGNRLTKRGVATGNNVAWWLRSAHSYSDVAISIVDENGYSEGTFSNAGDKGVRFALNIPLTSVIYTSSASNTNEEVELEVFPEQAPLVSAVSATGLTPTTEYTSKLTIKDSSRDTFSVTESSKVAKAESTIILNYTGAKTNAMEGYDNEYISVIIKNSDGENLYYGTLKENTTSQDAAGSVQMTLPDLEAGEYTLMILNEQRNQEKETNYAGYDIVELTISDDNTPPTATKGYGRTPNNERTYITLTATDEGIGLWKVVATPNANAEPLALFEDGKTKQQVRFSVDGTGIQSVYVVDKVGNVSDELSILIDNIVPTATSGYIGISRAEQ